jgi:hypothetical protein
MNRQEIEGNILRARVIRVRSLHRIRAVETQHFASLQGTRKGSGEGYGRDWIAETEDSHSPNNKQQMK